MKTQTLGAAPWLILMVTACSSSSTTQVLIAPDAGTGGSTSKASGGTKAVGGSTQATVGGSTTGGRTTSSAGGAPTGGATQSWTGGARTSGGASASGGQTNTGGTATSAGGSKPTGGTSSTVATATIGGSQATGGATSPGGASATGGAATGTGGSSMGGAATGGASTAQGGAATGGAATGGAATGGAATGGAATGGAATGGAATGGAGTGGTPPINEFLAGPCVTSSNMSEIEVFASNGQNIYRRVVGSSSAGTWKSLANLDAQKLDIRSDLDCSSSGSNVHLVATGSNPVGAYMRASGFGAAFTAFNRELSTLTPSTFNPPGVSVATWATLSDTRFQMAGSAGNPTWVRSESDGTITSLAPPAVYALNSGPDLAVYSAPDSSRFSLVAFNVNGDLAYYDFRDGMSSWWETVRFWPPPTSKTYSYSPTLCVRTGSTTDYTRHVAAVAGGQLYYAHSEADWSSLTEFTPWALVSNVSPASSPDCVVTSDNTVHIVVLTTNGTIAHVYRADVSGSWSVQDLGGY